MGIGIYPRGVQPRMFTTVPMETATLYFNDHLGPDTQFTEADFLAQPLLVRDAFAYLDAFTPPSGGGYKFMMEMKRNFCEASYAQTVKPSLGNPTRTQLASILNIWRAEHLKESARILGIRPSHPEAVHFADIWNVPFAKVGRSKAKIERPLLVAFETPLVVNDKPALLVITEASKNGANAGCLYVTDGGSYGSNVFYGRIEPDGAFIPSYGFKQQSPELMQSIMDALVALNTEGSHHHAVGAEYLAKLDDAVYSATH